MILKFTEYNEHEGETWNFFVVVEPEQAETFRKIIADLDADEMQYQVSTREYSFDDVEVLVRESGDTNYINQYNFAGTLDLDSLVASTQGDTSLLDLLYKGGIRQFCE